MKKRLSAFGKELYTNKTLYSMFLPAAIILILFNYLPMFGLITAFKDFNFADGILGSPWIQPLTKNFEYLFPVPLQGQPLTPYSLTCCL